MLFFLYAVFFVCCILIFKRILSEFESGFDWFSGSLYALIFLISCSLVWIFIFGIYYAAVGEMF
jgi:hypothetical protein